MIRAQKHRGPDGEGVFEGPGFLLGHNRLAILDLSETGHQPMELLGRDGRRLVLIYNGEIYNYLELRDELTKLGHEFRGHSDSEVLLHAYQEWGSSCLDRFNGMFAFVIYDEKTQRLFGARDRFGVKPLHLYMTAEVFAFASEIKAVLAVSNDREPDRQTVVDYLYSGHLHHAGRTFYRAIQELKGGHYFTYDLKSHQLNLRPWYSLRDRLEAAKETAPHLSIPDASKKVHTLLEDSVRIRLRSDVRVGTCLSGGIDSSSIASIAAPLYSAGPFIGITAESLDPANDESQFARAVAENAQLEWHTIKPVDFRDRLLDVVRTQDEPFSSLSVFMQDAVMQESKRLGVPVLLDGQGGDEVFLGYPKYLQAQALPPLRLLAKRAATAIGWLERRELATELAASSPDEVEISRKHLLRYRRALSNSREAQLLDITETNLPQLLRYEDRNSMRHSIETRLPFLDYRLVEFGLALPMRLKIDSGGVQKAVLRKAVQGLVPTTILERRDKIGFAAPDRVWQSHLQALWNEHVVSSKLVRDIISNVGSLPFGSLSPSMQWRLINLSLWSYL